MSDEDAEEMTERLVRERYDQPRREAAPVVYTTPRGTTVVVPGGSKSPPLPPGFEPGAGPSPEAERVVREAATAYHLHALGELEAESRQPGLTPEPEEVRSYEPVRNILDMAGILGHPLPRTSPRPAPAPAPEEELDEIERVRLEHLGREMARAVIAGEDLSEEAGERLDRALARPCGSAACRTLEDCLCRCQACKTACSRRRRRA